MKKLFSLLIIILSVSLTLAGCEKPDHDKILNEISEMNREYREKRQKFLNSDIHKAALKYVNETIASVLPDVTADISLEGGDLLGKELDGFADFETNDETKRGFFEAADLTLSINYGKTDVTAETLCGSFVNKGISGKLYDPDTSQSFYYEFSAKNGEYKKVLIPAV